MAERETIVSGDSKEALAYALLFAIASEQGKIKIQGGMPTISADLDWIKKNFPMCYRLAGGHQPE